MKHLTVDEIMDFVSLAELDAKSVILSAAVNGHIRSCEKCRKLVQSFSMIYEEFTGSNARGSLKEFAAEKNAEAQQELEGFL